MTNVRILQNEEITFRDFSNINSDIEQTQLFGIKKAGLFEIFTFRAKKIHLKKMNSQTGSVEKIATWVNKASLKKFTQRNLNPIQQNNLSNKKVSLLKLSQDCVDTLILNIDNYKNAQIQNEETRLQQQLIQVKNTKIPEELDELIIGFSGGSQMASEHKTNLNSLVERKQLKDIYNQEIKTSKSMFETSNEDCSVKDYIITYLNAEFLNLFAVAGDKNLYDWDEAKKTSLSLANRLDSIHEKIKGNFFSRYLKNPTALNKILEDEKMLPQARKFFRKNLNNGFSAQNQIRRLMLSLRKDAE